MAKNALETFVYRMEKDDSDVAVANSIRFIWNKRIHKKIAKPECLVNDRVIEQQEFMDKYYISFFGINNFPVNIWNKCYRKPFLDNAPNPTLTGFINEDLNYNLNVLPYVRRISMISDNLYFYRYGGWTNHYDPTILDTAISCYNIKYEKIKEYSLNQEYYYYTCIELLNYINGYFSQLVHYKNLNYEILEKEIIRVLEYKRVKAAIKYIETIDRSKNKYICLILKENFYSLYKLYINERKSLKYILKCLINKIYK